MRNFSERGGRPRHQPQAAVFASASTAPIEERQFEKNRQHATSLVVAHSDHVRPDRGWADIVLRECPPSRTRRQPLDGNCSSSVRAAQDPSAPHTCRKARRRHCGRALFHSGAPAAKAVTDCRGVTHITAPGQACSRNLAPEQVLSADH